MGGGSLLGGICFVIRLGNVVYETLQNKLQTTISPCEQGEKGKPKCGPDYFQHTPPSYRPHQIKSLSPPNIFHNPIANWWSLAVNKEFPLQCIKVGLWCRKRKRCTTWTGSVEGNSCNGEDGEISMQILPICGRPIAPSSAIK